MNSRIPYVILLFIAWFSTIATAGKLTPAQVAEVNALYATGEEAKADALREQYKAAPAADLAYDCLGGVCLNQAQRPCVLTTTQLNEVGVLLLKHKEQEANTLSASFCDRYTGHADSVKISVYKLYMSVYYCMGVVTSITLSPSYNEYSYPSNMQDGLTISEWLPREPVYEKSKYGVRSTQTYTKIGVVGQRELSVWTPTNPTAGDRITFRLSSAHPDSEALCAEQAKINNSRGL